METAVNYFAVFGGLDIKIDTTKPLGKLIERHILDEYYDLQDYVSKLTKNSLPYYKILTGIALGDRRVNSAFKRSDVDYEDGIKALFELEELEVITTETSIDHLTNMFEENDVADKLLFTTAFLRFWFAFVSPLYRGIKRKEYKEFYERFSNYNNEFMDFIFEQLCHEYIKIIFKDDEIEEIGRYWDEKEDINLVAQTQSGKVIVGSCKYSNNKIKTKELSKLKTSCEKLEIVPDFVILFSKKGFTNELKSLKNDSLKLFTVKSFKQLLD